jgi:mannose-6-phosphate isomerase-like protein (cupin superfamily)
MAGFTIKNFRDVDNSAPESAGEGLEARFARKHLDSEHLGVSYFRYGPDFKAPYGHRHREQEEAYVVIAGSGRVRLDDEIVDLKQWDVIRVAPPIVRAFQAGPDGLEIIAIGADRPEGGDGELVKDFWTD